MKLLLSLITFVTLSVATMAGGVNSVTFVQPAGGDNDSPYNMPVATQSITTGDLGILITANPYTVTTMSAQDIAEFDNSTLNATAGAGSGSNVVVVDNGAPGGNLTAEWKEQDGTTQKVVTKKGCGEKPKEFVKRHIQTVKLMKEAFPPA